MAENENTALSTFTGGGLKLSQNTFALLLDKQAFGALMEHAKFLSAAEIVPAHYRGKPADLAIAFMSAMTLEVDPLMFLKQTYVVHGSLGIQAQLCIALINQRFLKPQKVKPLNWELTGEGDARQCVAFSESQDGSRAYEGVPVTWKMAVAEGWTKNSKWTSMPELMFRYRAATFFGRLHCPEVLLGLPTVDELEDIGSIETTARRVNEEEFASSSSNGIPPMPIAKVPSPSSATDTAAAGTAPEGIPPPSASVQSSPTQESGADDPTLTVDQVRELWAECCALFGDDAESKKKAMAVMRPLLGELGCSGMSNLRHSQIKIVTERFEEEALKGAGK